MSRKSDGDRKRVTSRAIWTNKTRPRLAFESVHDLQNISIELPPRVKPGFKSKNAYPNFIRLWNAFSDAYNQANLVLNCLYDGVGGGGRWYVENSRVGFSITDCLNMSLNQLVGRRELVPTSRTDPKTGRPRCVWPAFLGDTPPTMFVPYASASLM